MASTPPAVSLLLPGQIKSDLVKLLFFFQRIKMPKIDTLDALEEHEEHEDDYQYQTNSN